MAAFAIAAVAQECNGSECNTDEISVLQVNLQKLSSDAKQQAQSAGQSQDRTTEKAAALVQSKEEEGSAYEERSAENEEEQELSAGEEEEEEQSAGEEEEAAAEGESKDRRIHGREKGRAGSRAHAKDKPYQMAQAHYGVHAKSHGHAQKGTQKKGMFAARSRAHAKSFSLRDLQSKARMWRRLTVVATKLAAASKARAEAKAKTGGQSAASVLSYMIRTQQKLAAETTRVRVYAEKRVLIWKKVAASKRSQKARDLGRIRMAQWQVVVNHAKQLENASRNTMARAVAVGSAIVKKGSATEAHVAKAHNMGMPSSSSQLANRKATSYVSQQLQDHMPVIGDRRR
eukprot:gnl/TRDRNA2_/TRDRNA2_176578_c4_seq9.p1 gnl/TRDRNA2_/TRDRNA2_176578_c4~~gnl/TRDRNA2_/TRDRNA2_176578_c4_seq9.p1  ORF type:complete len:360 (+),score=74.34 gnl/TRDRNA2_/TRDRNA2_176578_c4_seq9:51-1082(+)